MVMGLFTPPGVFHPFRSLDVRAYDASGRSPGRGGLREVGMASSQQSLERNAIGLTEVLFQSITHMAPAVATALSLGAATLFAGGNTPLAVVLALIAALFTAYSIGELARYLPSAGGMYTYVARGLGSFFGWLMAWAFLLAEPVVPAALFASFGLFGASLITLVTGLERLPVAPAHRPLRA